MQISLATAFCFLLLLCSFYDIKKRLIPNVLVAIIFALGLLNTLLYQSLHHSVMGILIPSIPLLFVRSKVYDLGAGDIKLLSAVGVWVGWLLNILVFVFACLAALVFAYMYRLLLGNRIKSVPFAPFISFAAWSLYISSLLSP